MADPDTYPSDYRAREINALRSAAQAGECAAVLGLSGAGKSNVLRCLAETGSTDAHPFVLIDANRLPAPTAEALLGLAVRALGDTGEPGAAPDAFTALDALIDRRLRAAEGSGRAGLTLMIDRFDALAGSQAVFGQLRALRDAHKYRLTYLIAARRPLDAHNELAELFFANTLWLGPLSESDARWTVARYTARRGLNWETRTVRALIDLTRGYPALLRAACEAVAGGATLSVPALAAHPAVKARLDEFWADQPTDEELRLCGLADLPLLLAGWPQPKGGPGFDTARPPATAGFDRTRLTAKENLLMEYFLAHPGEVCAKDDLIRAVWPEDRIFEQGVRDDSLAQLIRRLREKIEPDPARPQHILTVPGRGYRFTS